MEQSRRVFLGAAAATAAAGAATFLPVSRLSAQTTADVLGEALDRELVAALQLMAKNQTGEGPRRIASLLRLSAVHRARADATFRAAARAYVRREGREAVLLHPIDTTELASNLARFGFRFPPPAINPSRKVREQVLNELLANGPTRIWRNTADAFDRNSSELDKVAGAIRPVIDYSEACRNYTILFDSLAVTASLSCLFAPGSPVCVGATVAAAAQLAFLYYMGCR